jgi:CRP-like cAMP-binding protein
MFLSEIEPIAALVKAPGIVPVLPQSPCETCSLRSLQFCAALLQGDGSPNFIHATYRTTAGRRNIYRAGEPSEGVLVICEGWAVRFVQLPNGKRQILSVVLPGELVSPTAILERQFSFSVQAVTDVRYTYLPFAEVRARMRNNHALFDLWLRLSAAEHRNADKRLVDLGQRAAQERIAALITHIMSRYEERGELPDDEFPFPLSQQQIADCTGLTPVHTCRVLSWLRKNGICDVRHGMVKITDRGELQRLAAIK